MKRFNAAVGVAVKLLNQQIREQEQLKKQVLNQSAEVEQTFSSDQGNTQYYPIYSVVNHEMLIRNRDILLEYLLSHNQSGIKGWLISEKEETYQGLEELIQKHFDNETYMYGHQEQEMEDEDGNEYMLKEWYILIKSYESFTGVVDPMLDLQQRIQYVGLHTESPVSIPLPR